MKEEIDENIDWNDPIGEIKKALIKLVEVILIIIYSICVKGIVAKQCYEWFILPLNENLPRFSLLYFIAFTLTIRAIIPIGSINIKKEYKDKNIDYTKLFLPWITYLIAFIIHHIMTIAH